MTAHSQSDINFAARRLAIEMGANHNPRIQFGQGSSIKIATVITLVWPNGHRESLTLHGTKSQVYAQVMAAYKAARAMRGYFEGFLDGPQVLSKSESIPDAVRLGSDS